MVNCSVIQCSGRKSKNQPRLTLHRFPKGEHLRKKWLDAIGIENINPRHKNWHVCSLHFEEKYFNTTLDIMRLHEDAVPSLFLVKLQGCDGSTSKTSTNLVQDNTNVQQLFNYIQTETETESNQQIFRPHISKNIVTETVSDSNQDIIRPQRSTNILIEQLKRKCENQKKIIKNLNQKLQRRDKKIATLTQIIGDLQKQSWKQKDINFIEKNAQL